MRENLIFSLQGIWSHKLRSLLTILGIIIGIASIIAIVSTIKGTNEQIKENLVGAGNNAVIVRLTSDNYDYEFDWQGNPQGVKVLTDDTRTELLALSGVKDVSLYHSRSSVSNVYFRNTAYTGTLYGIDSHYLSIYGYKVVAGRNFLDSDYTGFHKAVLVDSSTATKLFSGENALGATLEIGGEAFTVVGIVEQDSSLQPTINSISDYQTYANQSGGSIFIPEAAWPIVYRYDEPQSVAAQAASTDQMTSVGKAVADALNQGYVTSTSVTYAAQDLLSQASSMQELANSTNKQLIWIAGISLLVGGIGVMNIMMVSVTERTREIGLKKAIGARRRSILNQFLIEAAVLCGIGGVLGVIFGIVFAKMMSAVMGTPTAISAAACIIAVVFSTLIGIVFGLAPAVKASKLNPIEALNHE